MNVSINNPLPDVAIVTLTHFSEVFRQLAQSVEKYELTWRDKTAVCDGYEPDLVQKWVWRCIPGSNPFNYARNWNIGLRATPSDCDVLLVNDDVQFTHRNTIHWLQQVAYKHPDVGVLSPLIDGEVGNPVQDLFLSPRSRCGFQVVESHIGFVCVYIKRSTIDKVGLMDERFNEYGGDDVDYCHRVQAAGLKLGVTSEVVVRHGFGDKRAGATAQRLNTLRELSAQNERMRQLLKEKEKEEQTKAEIRVSGGVYRPSGIDGWMTEAELQWLYETAQRMESVVEVGSWKGRSTHALSSGCPGVVTAVDHFRGNAGYSDMLQEAQDADVYEQFLKNTRALSNVKVICASSLEGVKQIPGLVDMVFLDAGHTEADIRADIRAWLPKCRKLICGHDYSNNFPEVQKVVDEELGEVQHVGSIWWQELPFVAVEGNYHTYTENDYQIRHRGPQDQFVIDEVINQDCYRLKKLAQLIPTPTAVVDVGGHIGCFGALCQRLWPKTTVYAYEPNHKSAALYRLNVPSAAVNVCAVSYEPEKTILAEHLGAASGGGILTTREAISSLPGDREISEEDVDSLTLDQVLQCSEWLDLLKLDCEGSEIEILKQMKPETARKIKLIVGEYHTPGGFEEFVSIVLSKFPDFTVVPLSKPAGAIGTFAAGPPEVVKGLLPSTGEMSAVSTPLGNRVYLTFTDGARVTVRGLVAADYSVTFINAETGENVYGTTLKHAPVAIEGTWAAPNPKYYVDWHVMVSENGVRVLDERLWLAGKCVLIALGSKSLGDTVAWMSYAEEFRQRHNCEVHVVSFWCGILEKAYPQVHFHDASQPLPLASFYARYQIGTFDNDYHKNKNNWRIIPLQQTASDTLGIPFHEIRPKVAYDSNQPPEIRSRCVNVPRKYSFAMWPCTSGEIQYRYVAISEFSTFRGKHWLYPYGWQIVVDYLNSRGYAVVSVSQEPTKLKNVICRNGRPIEETINNIRHASLFISVSNGPMWLAYALSVPSVVISGFTLPYSEMTDCFRVINPAVCTGCYNDISFHFDRAHAGTFCPRGKNFECSTSITPDMVLAKVKAALDRMEKVIDKPLSVRTTAENTIQSVDAAVTEPFVAMYPQDKPELYPSGSSPVISITTNSHAESSRVLFIAPHLSTGGLPQYLLHCVRQELHKGSKVEVIEWRNLSPLYVVQKLQIQALCRVRTLGNDSTTSNFAWLKHVLGEFNPTMVFVQETPETFMDEDSIRFLYSIPRAYTIVETSHNSGFNPAKKRFWPDRFSAVNRFHQMRMQEYQRNNTVDLRPYTVEPKPRPSRKTALESISTRIDPLYHHVLNVGLFAPNKNQGEVVAVARLLPYIRFHFVGNQAPNFKRYWEPLMADLPENCTIWGERDDVDKFYAAMDALLFPSQSELAPLVVKEALSWQMSVLMRNLPIYLHEYDDNPLVTFIDADIQRTERLLRERLGISEKE